MTTATLEAHDGKTSPAFAGPFTEQSTPVRSGGKKVPTTEAVSRFGHSFHLFTGRGTSVVRINNPEITVDSDVTASIGEMTANDTPFIGDALMRVCNVAPFNGGVFVRVEIGWSSNLRFQVMLHYSL